MFCKSLNGKSQLIFTGSSFIVLEEKTMKKSNLLASFVILSLFYYSSNIEAAIFYALDQESASVNHLVRFNSDPGDPT
jgi:hypothetical protein